MIRKTAINFRIDVEHVEALKKIAREMAYKKDRDITYIDLIKGAYEEKYGMEKKK